MEEDKYTLKKSVVVITISLIVTMFVTYFLQQNID